MQHCRAADSLASRGRMHACAVAHTKLATRTSRLMPTHRIDGDGSNGAPKSVTLEIKTACTSQVTVKAETGGFVFFCFIRQGASNGSHLQ
jgi:hypothetical protein